MAWWQVVLLVVGLGLVGWVVLDMARTIRRPVDTGWRPNLERRVRKGMQRELRDQHGVTLSAKQLKRALREQQRQQQRGAR